MSQQFKEPLSPKQEHLYLTSLVAANPATRWETISKEMTYDEARQLCHAAGIRRIKGNCRRVLARRLNRLCTVDTSGRLQQILKGTDNA